MDERQVERLRAHAERCPVAIPDTDGDVRAALNRLDELLGAVVDDQPGESASSVAAGQLTPAAHQAVRRLSSAVDAAERGAVAQPVAPDDCYELVPLAWAVVERADLVAMGLAVQAIGRAWGLGGDEAVADGVVAAAEASRMKPVDVVAEAARLHGLVSLPWDDDVDLLAGLLPAGSGRVVLDQTAHLAYERVADRILRIWHAGDPLAPWLYRGR